MQTWGMEIWIWEVIYPTQFNIFFTSATLHVLINSGIWVISLKHWTIFFPPKTLSLLTPKLSSHLGLWITYRIKNKSWASLRCCRPTVYTKTFPTVPSQNCQFRQIHFIILFVCIEKSMLMIFIPATSTLFTTTWRIPKLHLSLSSGFASLQIIPNQNQEISVKSK